MSAAEEQLPLAERPNLDVLPRVPFGQSAREARAEVERLAAREKVQYDAWRAAMQSREQQLANVRGRLEITAAMLTSVHATGAMLAAQVEQARMNAEHMEAAAASELQREIDQLASSHSARVREANRLLSVATQRRLELERTLSRALTRLQETARDVMDETSSWPDAERPGDDLARFIALVTGREAAVLPDGAQVGGGLVRIAAESMEAVVQSSAGTALGALRALLVQEAARKVVALEVGDDEAVATRVAADDMLSVRPGTVVVRAHHHVLSDDEMAALTGPAAERAQAGEEGAAAMAEADAPAAPPAAPALPNVIGTQAAGLHHDILSTRPTPDAWSTPERSEAEESALAAAAALAAAPAPEPAQLAPAPWTPGAAPAAEQTSEAPAGDAAAPATQPTGAAPSLRVVRSPRWLYAQSQAAQGAAAETAAAPAGGEAAGEAAGEPEASEVEAPDPAVLAARWHFAQESQESSVQRPSVIEEAQALAAEVAAATSAAAGAPPWPFGAQPPAPTAPPQAPAPLPETPPWASEFDRLTRLLAEREAVSGLVAPQGAAEPPAAPAAPAPTATPGVAPDVLAFLLGKRVGQDIRDAEGRIVAQRGERIDTLLAARVEAVGRLPELIVYMTSDEN